MMFSDNKPIYKQIVEYFYSSILNNKWDKDDRVPSVRELATLMEVNPNTAIRAFHELQDEKILYNKRGVGYFLSDDALSKVKAIKRNELIEVKLPALIKDMKLLDISFSEFKELFDKQADS